LIIAVGNTQGLAGNPANAALLLAFVLFAALLGGYLAGLVHIPKIVGYLAAGAVLKPLVVWYLALTMPQFDAGQTAAALGSSLRPLMDLALGMIVFMLGAALEVSEVKGVARRAFVVPLLELFIVGLLVAGGSMLLLAATTGGLSKQQIAMCILLGIVAAEIAPAATLLVLQEYEAKGPVSETILVFTGLNNLLLVVAFHVVFLCFAWMGWLVPKWSGRWPLLELTMTLAGSVGCGVLMGLALSASHIRLPAGQTLMIFLAALLLLGAGGAWLQQHFHVSLNLLIVSLVSGFVFTNVAVDPGKFSSLLTTLGAPLYAAFFVLAGYGLHLQEVAGLGAVGIGYILLRIAGKVISARIGVRLAGLHPHVRPSIAGALLCHAGLAIGLTAFLKEALVGSHAVQWFEAVVLPAVAIFEFAGPLILKRVLVQSGEVKAIHLISRETPSPSEGLSVSSVLAYGLRALFGRSPETQGASEPLSVSHVMRTNVRFLPPDATLDEVLRFVERSRLNHFPVVDERGCLLGIIDFEDISAIIYDPLMRELVTASDLAKPEAPVVTPTEPLDRVLGLFRRTGLGSVLVVDDPGSRRVVGIVELRDVLGAVGKPVRRTGRSGRQR